MFFWLVDSPLHSGTFIPVKWDPSLGYRAIRQVQGKMIPARSKSLVEIKTTTSFIWKFPIVLDGCQVKMSVIGRE
jgi:hypothetical protein